MPADVGEKKAREHNQPGVDVEQALGVDVRAVFVHSKDEDKEPIVCLAAREERCHDVASIDPVSDLHRQHVEQRHEHEPEPGEDRQVEEDVRFDQFADRFDKQVILVELAFAPHPGPLEPLFLTDFTVGQQQQEIDADDQGAGDEDHHPARL